MSNLKSLNAIAKKDDLKLVKGKGYFYWIGLTDEMHQKCFQVSTTSVYVYAFKHLSFEQWLEEFEKIKKEIIERDKELKENASDGALIAFQPKSIEEPTYTTSDLFVIVEKGIEEMIFSNNVIYTSFEQAEANIKKHPNTSELHVVTLEDHINAVATSNYDQGAIDHTPDYI